MKLWLNDIRLTPIVYVWITTVDNAILLCGTYLDSIEEFNLDHDAGTCSTHGGDYINLLKWLEMVSHTKGYEINAIFKFHSMNPVGVKNMKAICYANNWKVEE